MAIAASTSMGCGVSVGLSAGSSFVDQKSGWFGIHDEHAQVVFRGLDLAFGDDHLLFLARDFGLGLNQLDRRHRADFDAPLVVPQRGAREFERLLRDVERADRVHQHQIRTAHVSRRLRQRLPQLDVGDLLPLLAELHCSGGWHPCGSCAGAAAYSSRTCSSRAAGCSCATRRCSSSARRRGRTSTGRRPTERTVAVRRWCGTIHP